MTREKADDRRKVLQEAPFSYSVSKEGKVFIAWEGQQVCIFQGKDAERFIKRIGIANANEAQLIMAKCTGNFKRGNERLAKQKNR